MNEQIEPFTFMDNRLRVLGLALGLLPFRRLNAHLHVDPFKEMWQISVGELVTVPCERERIRGTAGWALLNDCETGVLVAPAVPLEQLLALLRYRTRHLYWLSITCKQQRLKL